MAGLVKMTVIGGDEIVKSLDQVSRRLQKRWIRGAVGEALNVIKDQARLNAMNAHLVFRGPMTTPSGRIIIRRGQIPFGVDAYVRRGGGKRSSGIVYVRSGKRGAPDQTYHWKFLEFGSVHNTPTPFFLRSVNEAKEEAGAAAIEVLTRQLNNYFKGGGR